MSAVATKQRIPNGVYKPCTGPGGCGGRGWKERTPSGQKIPHARCGGDGWIKVGPKPGGRRPRRGRLGRTIRSAATNTVTSAGVTVAGYAFFGTVGAVVVIVLVALLACLAVHRAVAGAGW